MLQIDDSRPAIYEGMPDSPQDVSPSPNRVKSVYPNVQSCLPADSSNKKSMTSSSGRFLGNPHLCSTLRDDSGGGTAGCVVAGRLAEDSNARILLIEVSALQNLQRLYFAVSPDRVLED